jgi:hypothetical protein
MSISQAGQGRSAKKRRLTLEDEDDGDDSGTSGHTTSAPEMSSLGSFASSLRTNTDYADETTAASGYTDRTYRPPDTTAGSSAYTLGTGAVTETSSQSELMADQYISDYMYQGFPERRHEFPIRPLGSFDDNERGMLDLLQVLHPTSSCFC